MTIQEAVELIEYMNIALKLDCDSAVIMKKTYRLLKKHLKSRYLKNRFLLRELHTIFKPNFANIVENLANILKLIITNINTQITNALVVNIYVLTECQIIVGIADRL